MDGRRFEGTRIVVEYKGNYILLYLRSVVAGTIALLSLYALALDFSLDT